MYSTSNRRELSRPVKRQILVMTRHLSTDQVAAAVEISPRTVRRIKRLYATTGDVISNNPLARRPRLLDSLDVQYILSCLDRRPDSSLSDLRHELQTGRGTFVSEVTISRTLARCAYSRKMLSRKALEASAAARARFIAAIGHADYSPEHIVAVDETGVNRHTIQVKNGWAPIGARAERTDHLVRGKRFTILPAISLQGVLHVDIFTCSSTTTIFNTFIRRLLEVMNPWPLPNSVIVLDNASTHYSEELEEMVAARGCRIVYLPPYSPDLNPIEEFFSALKARLRARRDFLLGAMNGVPGHSPYTLMYEAIYETTPKMIEGWYRDCGYVE